MPGRQLHPDGKCSFAGQVEVDFSFVLQGTGAISLAVTPTGTAFRGEGILPTGSIVYTGSTGIYLVTLDASHSYRYHVCGFADLDDSVNDGAYATIGNFTGESAASPTPITFKIYTRAAAGTLTNYSGRRCKVGLSMKASAVGG